MSFQPHWYKRAQYLTRQIPPRAEHWLFDPSSLTARLIQRCGSSFNVRLLSQSYRLISAEEKHTMSLNHGNSGLIREVLLCDNQQPLVYARTVIPASTLTGSLRRYANLGNRPLGAMLFADRTMRRGEVEITETLPQHCCRSVLFEAGVDEGDTVWGRRSVFRVRGRPLLVSEYFLPVLVGEE